MVFKFLIICALVPFSQLFACWVFNGLLWATGKRKKTKEKTLFQMLEDGDLETDVSFPEQFALLAATDEEGNEVEIEALDDGFDKVDIDRYKRKLEANRSGNTAIVLEI